MYGKAPPGPAKSHDPDMTGMVRFGSKANKSEVLQRISRVVTRLINLHTSDKGEKGIRA